MGIRELFGIKPKGVADRYFDLKSPPVSMLYGGERGALSNEFRQLPIVYAVVNAIAQRVSSVPEKFYRAGTDTEISSHDAADRLMSPMFSWTWEQWLQAWVINKEITGEFFAVKNSEALGGVPSSIDIIKREDYKPVYRNGTFVGWDVKGKYVEHEQVIFDRYVNPWDKIRGLSKLEAARVSNETEWSARRFNKKFFDNDASPGGYFKTEGALTERQRQAMRHDMIEARKGAENAHSWMLLEGDMTMEQLGVNQRDAQFIEQMNLTLHDVCAVFGVDPAIIGFEKESKYASAKEARKYLWTDVIIPYLYNIERVVNNQFLAPYNIELHFDTSEIDALQTNYVETVTAAKTLYEMGVPFNMINERLDLGFEEVPGGDEPRVTAGPMMLDAKPAEQKEAVIGPPVREGRVGNDEAQKAVNFMAWKSVNDEVTSLAAGLNKQLKKYFFQAKKKLEKKIGGEKAFTKDITVSDIDDAIGFDQLAKIIIRFLTESGVIGWKQIAGVDVSFDNPPQAVLELVANRAGMVKEITESARAEIRKILFESIEGGATEEQTRRVLLDRLDKSIDNLQSRARTIARTEVHTAHSEARYRAMQETEPTGKRWVSAPDARESHVAAMEQGIIKFDEPFHNGLQYPLDGNGEAGEVINCRCVMVPIYEGEDDE